MGQNLIAAFGVSLTLTWHTWPVDITNQNIYSMSMNKEDIDVWVFIAFMIIVAIIAI